MTQIMELLIDELLRFLFTLQIEIESCDHPPKVSMFQTHLKRQRRRRHAGEGMEVGSAERTRDQCHGRRSESLVKRVGRTRHAAGRADSVCNLRYFFIRPGPPCRFHYKLSFHASSD